MRHHTRYANLEAAPAMGVFESISVYMFRYRLQAVYPSRDVGAHVVCLGITRDNHVCARWWLWESAEALF